MNIPAEIIEGCLKNKRSAQFSLYKLCYGYMMAICSRYERNKEDAEFLLNLSFYKILKNLDKMRTDTRPEPWIKRITINTIIDEFRKRKRDKIAYYEDPEIVSGPFNFQINEAEDRLNAGDLEKLIKQLPETTQKVFNLYVIDGYNHKEIGELLNLNEGTCKWHLFTARKKLKEMLEKLQNNVNSFLL